MSEGAKPSGEVTPEILAAVALARKGAGAEGAQQYLGNKLWERLWKAITNMANCKPDLPTMMMYKSEIAVCMKLAQDMQIDIMHSREALAKVRELFKS